MNTSKKDANDGSRKGLWMNITASRMTCVTKGLNCSYNCQHIRTAMVLYQGRGSAGDNKSWQILKQVLRQATTTTFMFLNLATVVLKCTTGKGFRRKILPACTVHHYPARRSLPAASTHVLQIFITVTKGSQMKFSFAFAFASRFPFAFGLFIRMARPA